MAAALPIIMMVVFGAPTFAAMTPALWVLFALGVPGNVKTAIKVGRDVIIVDKVLIAYLKSPAFRAWAARNGEMAIKLQPGERTER